MTVRWKEGAVISVAVKNGRRVLAQMLERPFLYFLWCFADADEPFDVDLADVPTLFCCAVTSQFMRFSEARKETQLKPRTDIRKPELWIEKYRGFRHRVVWPGTDHEVTVLIMGAKPGGKLIMRGEHGMGPDIGLDDHETIDNHGLSNIEIFPGLNERLHLINTLGRNVDPMRDLSFDRPMPLETKTFVDIIGSRGELEDWGYRVPAKYAAKRAAALKKKAAEKKKATKKKKKATTKKKVASKKKKAASKKKKAASKKKRATTKKKAPKKKASTKKKASNKRKPSRKK
jgi:hypothetical protein